MNEKKYNKKINFVLKKGISNAIYDLRVEVLVLLCVQLEASLFSWNGMGLYDHEAGAPRKNECIYFEQFAI